MRFAEHSCDLCNLPGKIKTKPMYVSDWVKIYNMQRELETNMFEIQFTRFWRRMGSSLVSIRRPQCISINFITIKLVCLCLILCAAGHVRHRKKQIFRRDETYNKINWINQTLSACVFVWVSVAHGIWWRQKPIKKWLFKGKKCYNIAKSTTNTFLHDWCVIICVFVTYGLFWFRQKVEKKFHKSDGVSYLILIILLSSFLTFSAIICDVLQWTLNKITYAEAYAFVWFWGNYPKKARIQTHTFMHIS